MLQYDYMVYETETKFLTSILSSGSFDLFIPIDCWLHISDREEWLTGQNFKLRTLSKVKVVYSVSKDSV